MGVKSTVYLTRKQAEDKFIDLYIQRKMGKFRAKAAVLSDTELENKLERWNDEANDGEGFENYIIDPTGECR
jgi:hypothetical protein